MGQGGVHTFENVLAVVYEDEADAVEVYVRVVAFEDVKDKVMGRGRRLDPSRPAADEDEG